MNTGIETPRLLVVDDQEMFRDMIMTVGKNSGFNISLACDGVEALEFATRERVDIIIMDIKMPRMNGIEATRQIKLLPDYKDVDILGFSGDADDITIQKCIDVGMTKVFHKPSQIIDIMAFIKKPVIELTN